MPQSYSVVIPAYNAAATIVEAIESVMAQTVSPETILVVDDGSADETAAIVAKCQGPIQLLRRPNGGPGAATNDGIGAVKTPLFATLDADDLWLPDKIQRQMEFLAAHPEIRLVFAHARIFKGSPTEDTSNRTQPFWGRTTMLAFTDSARQVGPIIDPPGGRGDMIDWLARCEEMGFRSGMMDDVLTLRRIRPGSLSYGRDSRLDAGYLYVVRRALERKRHAHMKERMAG